MVLTATQLGLTAVPVTLDNGAVVSMLLVVAQPLPPQCDGLMGCHGTDGYPTWFDRRPFDP